jgi:hypothetical protein
LIDKAAIGEEVVSSVSRGCGGRALAIAATMLFAAVLVANVHAADRVRVANFQNTIALALFHGMDKGYLYV